MAMLGRTRDAPPFGLPGAGRRATARFAAAAAILAGAAAPSPLAAQPAQFRCAPVLPSASREPRYARLPGKEQCEGYFEQTVSQPFIELLSLTRHRPDALPAAAQSSTALRIRIDAAVPMQLTIVPLRPSPFYRVDARLAPGRVLDWNAGPMLASTGVRLAGLGFLARAASANPANPGDPAAPLVAPVSLSSTADGANLAYATLRVSVPVTSVAARQYRAGSAGSWRELPGTPLYEWDTIVLPITLEDSQGALRVEVRAVGTDGSLLPLLQFVVAGR